MTTKIRVMKEEDIDSIMDIWIQENISAHNFIDEKYWKTNKDKVQNQILKSKTFVYEDENEIKGFIGLSGNYIEGLFVKSQYQRRGIGKELLKHCKEIFWSLILKVYSENEAAVNFYEKNAFFQRDKMDNAETGKTELYMEWIK